MKHYQKSLEIGIIVALGLITRVTGCNIFNKNITLEGIVKEEFGTAQKIVELSEVLYKNEIIQIGDLTYGIIIVNEKGEYTINIKNHSTKSVIKLAKEIEQGDRIRIRGNYSTRIRNNKTGTTDSNTIEIIEKAKN